MTIVHSILLLCIIGIIAGLALYFVAKKFKTDENPLYGEVESMLPGANCGGCGFPGCKKFAQQLVDSPSLEGLNCTAGGADTMNKIGVFLGKSVESAEMRVAVIKCKGSCDKRPKTINFEGISSCAFAASQISGDTACSFGCIGLGDCERECQFGGIKINPEKKTLLAIAHSDERSMQGFVVTPRLFHHLLGELYVRRLALDDRLRRAGRTVNHQVVPPFQPVDGDLTLHRNPYRRNFSLLNHKVDEKLTHRLLWRHRHPFPADDVEALGSVFGFALLYLHGK